ncbi:MAG: type IV pilus biogenesis protein PilM [Deltaproteobacteria bacterium]
MPELLAIEWEHEQVCGVLADVSPGRVRIERTFVIPKPTAAASGTGPIKVDWLASEMKKLGLEGGQTLVALPRDEAIVKRLELPEVPDDELPVMVRFQAGAKSSVALDDLALDFIPLPRRNDVPGREVLMATVPRQTIDEVVTVCRSGGLEPVVIGLTAAAVAEFVARAESPADNAAAGASLVVARHGNRIEISMLRRCHLLFSHSARLSDAATGQQAQAIVAEVSRALVALRGAIADVKIERAWTLVSAAEHEQLAESLHRRLQCEVVALDPFTSVDRDERVAAAIADRSLFAGPIGMLLARADARVPGLDFLSPRQPAVKRDLRRQRLIRAGAGALALVLLLGTAQWMRLSNLDAQVQVLVDAESKLDKELAEGAPTKKSSDDVAKWMADGEDWLDELPELAARMPGTDRVYLKSLRCEPRTSGSGFARFNLQGLARERQDALSLNERFLAAGDRYQGMPVVERPEPKPPEYYSWSFDKEIRLMGAKDGAGKKRSRGAVSGAASPDTPGTATDASPVPVAKPAEGRPAASIAPAARGRASS